VKILEEARIPIGKIRTGRFQVRMTPTRVGELAASLRSLGLLQKVMVRPIAGGEYELVFGHQRLRAHKMDSQSEIEAVVVECTDQEAMRAAVAENVTRSELSAYEKESAIYRLWKEGGFDTQTQLADSLGLNRSWISREISAHEYRVKHHISDRITASNISEVLVSFHDDRLRKLLLRDADEGVIPPWTIRDICREWAEKSNVLVDLSDESVRSVFRNQRSDIPGGKTAWHNPKQPDPRRILDEFVHAIEGWPDVEERRRVALDGYNFLAMLLDVSESRPKEGHRHEWNPDKLGKEGPA